MNDERQAFSRRLAEAMEKAGYKPRPGELHKAFNSHYEGASVSEMTASRWLNGKAIPAQDKLQVLAGLFSVEPHFLRFGGRKPRVGEGRPAWEAMTAPDRAMMDAFLALPPAQRKLVRELVAALGEGKGK
ncbi:transcriptional regulator [Pseudoluteimonas lycopersici]|uniref:Transcriptional regulator n=1 Tax=Pseudoluteimonas lycopersici TaxID=1324796 RepID=A0A516V569_9GAMM|nr:transcriptional regulator [Lysobacter lycopersici]QDQ73675.1 transcriptional regulator [Lysobacter lycopersici]